ncbi:hypothetical protein DICVIV_08346 [Dictyocaulus viviparus]|uniref:DAGKc domain-containing protein n=1 Tax=Dictyocaulus viviparus TaxID=29172 RepID=A0A0D8XM34_DICVI|nr:hypothetical protein DICVIV_08346 [Dictyocaulus viviparus]
MQFEPDSHRVLVLNGLSERKDRKSIIPALPFGVVPSGSGNGLLSSLFFSLKVSPFHWCHHFSEPLTNPNFTDRAIEICCSPRSRAQPVNLIHVQSDRENRVAFLSVGWGLVADIGQFCEAQLGDVFATHILTTPLKRSMSF